MKGKVAAKIKSLFRKSKRERSGSAGAATGSPLVTLAENSWLRTFIRTGDLVFDVGANAGQKTEAFLSCGARLVCVEPQPDCVRVLEQKFGSRPDVCILQKGLADKPGVMTLQICSSANTISTFSEDWKHGRFSDYQWDKTIPVEVTTLDELIARHGRPRYCKIDVEGFEEVVLRGITRPVPCLSFEFAREFLPSARRCASYLEGIGYREFNLMLAEEQSLAFSGWMDAEQLFSEIDKLKDPLLWGDIYARHLEQPVNLTEAADAPGVLERAQLWNRGEPLRLHLGCGEQHLAGYINIDYPPEQHNVMDVQADAWADVTRLGFPESSVDEVRLHHVFEHLNRVTALAMLIKWHRWLKPGGMLRIETPDLLGSARTIAGEASFREKMAAVRHLAGDQAAAWAYHLDHWFPERYQRTLGALGFKIVTIKTTSWPHEPHLSNVEVIATKQRQTPLDEQLLQADQLLEESTVSPGERPTWDVWKQQLRALLDGEIASTPVNARLSIPAAIQRKWRQAAAAMSRDEIHNFNQNERDRWVRAKAATVGKDARVLDVGAGTCPYRDFFSHCDYRAHDFKKYDGIKLGNTREYGRIDYESDITRIPAPDDFFDVILCTEVLEHVTEPIEALREMARLVKPGGRLMITAPLGSGLHQLPYHFYGGYTPEWYKHFARRFGLVLREITPNGGFFRLLGQECARVSWTLPEHQHLHGKDAGFVRDLFGEMLPRYLFALEEKHFIDQFTVGYHVEAVKPGQGAEAVQRLIEQEPGNLLLRAEAVRLCIARGDRALAERYLDEGLRIDSSRDDLRELRDQLGALKP
jgi:FkbM family methyltransferase